MRTIFIALVMALVVILICGASIAAPAVTFEVQGSTLWDNVRHVRVSDGYAYYTYAFGLKIYDISDPANPVFVSELDFHNRNGSPVEPDIAGAYLYQPLSMAGIFIIDVSDPYNPVQAGFYPIEERLLEVQVQGGYLYLAKSPSDLVVYELTDPVNPVEVAHLSEGPYRMSRSFDVSGSVAAMANDWNGVTFYDISNPANPIKRGVYDPYGNEYDVDIVGNYACVAGRGYGLTVVNISDLQHPAQIGQYDPPDEGEYIEDVAVVGNYAYIANNDYGALNGYRVIDISNPGNPVCVATAPWVEDVGDITVTGGMLFALNQDCGFRCYDISVPSAPAFLSRIRTPRELNHLAVEGNRAYVISRSGGPLQLGDFYILDITDRSHPVVLAEYPDFHSSYGYNIAARGTTVFIGWGNYLQIIDASNPAALNVLHDQLQPNSLREFFLRDNYLFVLNVFDGLTVFDISDLSFPRSLSTAELPSSSRGIDVKGDYAYIGNQHGMYVIDVSDVSALQQIGYYEYRNLDVRGLTASDAHVYLVSQTASLMILDVSEPTNPRFLGQSGSYADESVIFDLNDLVVTASTNGFMIFDLFEPANPLFVYQDRGGYSLDAYQDETHTYNIGPGGFTIYSYGTTEAVYGDADQSGDIDVGDAVTVINFVFKGGAAPVPLRSGDANCDGAVNVGDAVNLINFIFKGGPAPGCGK